MINEQYIILLVTLKGLSLATSKSFDHQFQAKEWIKGNGKDGSSYLIQTAYSKK